MTLHDRREFIKLATAALASFAAGCTPARQAPPCPAAAKCDPGPKADWHEASHPNVRLPHLGGAPDTAEGWAIAAFVDTVVPGAWRDPTGAPGGLDAGVPGLFFDPALPALGFVPLLVGVLDGYASRVRMSSSFATITPAQRDQALELAMEISQMGFAVQLVKLGFFSSKAAACHLGYPGPNAGYVEDPLFSFAAPLTTEITTDGNFA